MDDSIKRILENSYLFYFCRKPAPDKNILMLKKKIEKMQVKYEEYCDNHSYYFIIKNSENDKYIYVNKFNEQYDYDLENVWENIEKINYDYPLPDYDTVLSYSLMKNYFFVAVNDYNAMMKHYYYIDDDIFICSNNSFLVAFLCDSYVSNEAIYETFFFRFPYKSGSFFKNVKSLKPFQILKYNIKDNTLKLSNSIFMSELTDTLNINTFPEAADDFFSRLKLDFPVNLSFSGGSDSTTIAALLTKYKIPFKMMSFEGHNDYDTKRIMTFSKKTKTPFFLIEAKEQDFSEQSGFEYTVLSNGYTVSNHFFNFYKNIEKSDIFDGYSFIIGDYSNATISEIYAQILKSNDFSVVNDYLLGFDNGFLQKMYDYIKNNYTFVDCNSEGALKDMQKFIFYFVAGTVNAGAILPSLYFGHRNYCFYLSKKFMLTILKNGYGLAESYSLRNDYPGYAKSKYPLGILSNYCNNVFGDIKMDSGISLNDIYSKSELINKIRIYLYKKRRTLMIKTFYKRNDKLESHVFKPKAEEFMKFSGDFVSDFSKLKPEALVSLGTSMVVKNSFILFCDYFKNN